MSLTIDGELYLTTAEAARKLGRSESAIRVWIHRGLLWPLAKRDPRDRTYISATQLEEFNKVVRRPGPRPKAVKP